MERITKIAENNVKVEYAKEVIDIEGKVFNTFDNEKNESFGQEKLTEELREVENHILYWQVFDEKAYKTKMLDECIIRKALLLKVQKEMDKK